jgi:hypothetical protein
VNQRRRSILPRLRSEATPKRGDGAITHSEGLLRTVICLSGRASTLLEAPIGRLGERGRLFAEGLIFRGALCPLARSLSPFRERVRLFHQAPSWKGQRISSTSGPKEYWSGQLLNGGKEASSCFLRIQKTADPTVLTWSIPPDTPGWSNAGSASLLPLVTIPPS